MKRAARRLLALWDGISDDIPLVLAVGFVLGTFPVYGIPTLLCVAAARALRLNPAALLAVNQLATPIQLALPPLLDQRHTFQKQLILRVRENLAELDRQLASQRSATRLHIKGGWYAVLRVPATRSERPDDPSTNRSCGSRRENPATRRRVRA